MRSMTSNSTLIWVLNSKDTVVKPRSLCYLTSTITSKQRQ